MRILVLSQMYPLPSSIYSMGYVHARSLHYQAWGHEVEVVNFSAAEAYEFRGVPVHAGSEAKRLVSADFDLVVAHAPNMRNLCRILWQVQDRNVAVFFHGHEVLRLLQDYPPPFPWNKRRTRYQLAYRFVDYAKMHVVRTTLNRIRRRNNVGLVFVSEWMRRQFERNVGTSTLAEIPHRCIFNSVAEHFERRTYDRAADVAADFVTIRPLDDSKYGVDLVLDAARGNPNRSFHIFGRGEFFKHFEQPPNVTWSDRFIDQADLPDLLDQYRAALMPTRYDAQGVMACEMATYGIPLITSSIDVMDEVFDGVEGVTRIPNDSFGARLDDPIFELPGKRTSRFLSTDLIERELAFFSEIIHTDQQ